MRLAELIQNTPLKQMWGNLNTEITSIAYDSRKVTSGCLFVCIDGLRTDGHHYIPQALENGAAAIAVQKLLNGSANDVDTPVKGKIAGQRFPVPVLLYDDTRAALAHLSAAFYGFPARRFRLIGVTGTNGKTTVTYLIRTILQQAGRRVGLIGTNQNIVGDTIYPTERTTPESLELQQLFYEMARAGADDVVMEVSSHSLALRRVAGIEFQCAAFTNLTQDHLDFHKTMDEYARAKARLFEQAASGVINADDPAGHIMAEHAKFTPLWYGIASDAAKTASSHSENPAVFATDVHLHAAGVDFVLHAPSGAVPVNLGIPGLFSVSNALCAAAVCVQLGLSPEQIAQGLLTASGVRGRAEVAYRNDRFTVLIDYAHTPDGLVNILRTLKEFAKGRVVTVFGCGGDRDRTKRPQMGAIATKYSDFAIITSDNPRTEDPAAILADIVAGIEPGKTNYTVIENRREAIRYALEHAQQDDLILLAGKGHETYQEINGQRLPFDERVVLREILEAGRA